MIAWILSQGWRGRRFQWKGKSQTLRTHDIFKKTLLLICVLISLMENAVMFSELLNELRLYSSKMLRMTTMLWRRKGKKQRRRGQFLYQTTEPASGRFRAVSLDISQKEPFNKGSIAVKACFDVGVICTYCCIYCWWWLLWVLRKPCCFRELDLRAFKMLKCGLVSKAVLDSNMNTKVRSTPKCSTPLNPTRVDKKEWSLWGLSSKCFLYLLA